MSTADLQERIAALPPEKREKAERTLGRRERLRAAIGSLDNHNDIRDFRESPASWRH